MHHGRVNMQFCGFGGQGIVLSAVIFGTAAVTRAGLNAVQTQSYGSEARGGECQAEVIVSDRPINSPLADHVDILVGMSQAALNKYLGRLRSRGTLIIDPEFVEKPP
ncbi:MAG: ketoisovalerate oxidoreductase, partial [Deltaproteobacteria bacterium]|nr:ketoisovalerate oxidoreductase [Deltaproteobacteria bacterium]